MLWGETHRSDPSLLQSVKGCGGTSWAREYLAGPVVRYLHPSPPSETVSAHLWKEVVAGSTMSRVNLPVLYESRLFSCLLFPKWNNPIHLISADEQAWATSAAFFVSLWWYEVAWCKLLLYKIIKLLLKESQPLSKSNSCEEKAAKFLAGHREAHPYLIITIYNTTSIIRISKIGSKSWTTILHALLQVSRSVFHPWAITRLPLMATDIAVHCLPVPLVGQDTGTKPRPCTGRDRPMEEALQVFYFFNVCGFISHRALLWCCLHPLSSLLTLSQVLVFLASLWIPAVTAELMHVLLLAQFRPAP